MKKFISLLLSLSLLLSTFVGTGLPALADGEQAYAVWDENDSTMTFYYDGNFSDYDSDHAWLLSSSSYHASGSPTYPAGNGDTWAPTYTVRTSITKAVFDSSFDSYRPTSTAYWFYYYDHMTEIEDIQYLHTDNVTYMSYMFGGCSSLPSLDVTHFNTSSVTSMDGMFARCGSLTSLDVANFNTSSVTSMDSMFSLCSGLTSLDLSSFDTSSVTDMSNMFSYCSSLTSLDVTGFDTSSVTDMSWMFSGCSSLTSLDLSSFNTSRVTNMVSMFQNCSSLPTLDVTGFNTSSVTNMSYMFSGCRSLPTLDVTHFNTSRVTDMTYMFQNCRSLPSLDVTNFNTSSVTSMAAMFYSCSSLPTLDVTHFNTSRVTNMSSMFRNCSSLPTLDVTSFDTSRVTNMSFMFQSCNSLPSLDVTHFDTSSVTDMRYMFSSCSRLTSLDVTHFNTSRVTDMTYMFSGCSSLPSLDVTNFDTSSVTNMAGIFSGCSSLPSLDLSSFNTSSVTNMKEMFYGCTNLDRIWVSDLDVDWNTVTVTNSTNMFTNCTSLVGNYSDKEYNASDVDVNWANVRTGYFSVDYELNNGVNLEIGETVYTHFYIDYETYSDFLGADHLTYTYNGIFEDEQYATATETVAFSSITNDQLLHDESSAFDGDYIITVRQAPAQIAEPTVITIYNAENVVIDTLTYSGKSYCDYVIAGEDDRYIPSDEQAASRLTRLCKSVVQYAKSAQALFPQYMALETSVAITNDYSDDLGFSSITTDGIPALVRTNSDSVTFNAASFFFSNESGMNFYYALNTEDELAAPAVEYPGWNNALTAQPAPVLTSKNGMKCINFSQIHPINYDKQIKVTYGGAVMQYSVFNYAKQLISTGNAAYVAAGKSIIAYQQATASYVG